MKLNKQLLVVVALVITVGLLSMSYINKGIRHEKAVASVALWYKNEVMRFDSMLAAYPKYYLDSSYETRVEKFEALTRQVKKIEGLFIYFHPKLAYETFFLPAQLQTRDFGAPFPDNWLFLGPFGIDPDSTMKKFKKEDSVFTAKFIQRSVQKYRAILKDNQVATQGIHLKDAELFEALRLQMMRISTMGISNADFVVTQTAQAALEGEVDGWTAMMELVLAELPESMRNFRQQMASRMTEARAVLAAKPGYRSFDRLEFLTRYLVPLATDLYNLQIASDLKSKPRYAAVKNTGKHIYEENIFNPEFFASSPEAGTNPAREKLGRFLFFDPILSDNNERACASCHKPEMAFTDGLVKSVNFERGDLPRNSPTVINAVFQKNQFWDLRASSLEDQLDSVINSADELHSSFKNVIDRVNSSTEYKEMFYAAFPESKKTGIERKHIKIAIACYERQLTGMNSRFDQYMQGDHTKLSAGEINGFNLFVGQAKCGTCHYAPLFNGAIPPYFEITDHRSLGVPAKDTMDVYALDGDVGVFKATNNPFFNFSFKIPTVRNAALTAPYMHNGIYRSLEQVVDFYNDAAGNKFEKDMRPGMKGLPFFMILSEKLNLTPQEKADLVSFMGSLTDTSCATNVPKRLPVISGKHAKLNDRVIGGIY